MNAQFLAEMFTNQKCIYDHTTACELPMIQAQINEKRNVHPQQKHPPNIPRHAYLFDMVMGGAQTLRELIIQEREILQQDHQGTHPLTPAKDLPFTMPELKWKDSVFYKYQQAHNAKTPKVPEVPNYSKRGSMKFCTGISRNMKFKPKRKPKRK